MAEDDTGSNYVRTSRTVDSWGYGAAGTYFILSGLQAKLSYEKAYRLPTIEEMFGDEDLESGDIGIRPEKSDNINLNLEVIPGVLENILSTWKAVWYTAIRRIISSAISRT